MSSPSQAVASDVLAHPSVERRARSREFLYAMLAIAFLFVVLAAMAIAGGRSERLAGEEGADVVALQPLVADRGRAVTRIAMRAWSAATTAPLPPTRASRVAWSAATLVALTARVASFAAALHDRW